MNVDNLNIVIKANANAAKSALRSLVLTIDSVSDVTEKLSKAWNKFGSAVQKGVGKAVGVFKNFFNQLTGVKLNFADMLGLSMDYIENLNLWKVSMGECIGEATRFQNTMAEAFGTNLSDAVRYQAVFQQMSDAIGMTNKQANVLSENMTKLGYDISSFYNISVEDAMAKLQAGLAGQTKPLRSLGMDITQQSLTPILQSLGINDRSVSELSQAEKMVLRYIAVMRQSTNAQTDMARTIEQPANQLRILRAQVIECGRWFGNVFIGTFGAVIPYINGVVMAIKELIKLLANLVGFQNVIADVGEYGGGMEIDTGDDGSSLASNMGKAAKSAKQINENLQSIDEVHNLTEDSGSSGGTGGGGGGAIGGIDSRLLEGLKGYDNLMGGLKTKANDIRDAIMEWLGFTKQVNEETQEIYWIYTGDGWVDVGRKITEGFQIATDFLRDAINSIDFGRIGEIFNLAISELDTGSIASNIASVFGDLALQIQNLFLAIDWGQVMDKLTTAGIAWTNTITDYINKIDFTSIGQKITDLFVGYNLAETITANWGETNAIYNGIIDMISGIDWGVVAKELSDGAKAMLKGISNWFTGVNWGKLAENLASGIFDALYNIDWVGLIMGLLDLLVSAIKALIDVIIGVLKGLFKWENLKPVLDLVGNAFKLGFESAKNLAINVVKTLITGVVNIVKDMPNKIKDALSKIPQIFKDAFNNAKKMVSNAWDGIKKMFSAGGKMFVGLKDGVAEVFKTMVNSIIKGINKIIKVPFQKVNDVLNGIRNTNIPVINVKPFKGLWGKDPVPVPKIPQLATGGFPDEGQMFIAGEKGPELVGKIGTRSAVVNNDQIVQSVSQGVAQAVASVMGEGNSSEITGTIDGQTFIKLVVNGINGMTTKNGKFPLKIT